MNIAIFTNNYLPNPYGVSTSIETFRREFEKRGHVVYIFAPNFPGYKDENPRVFRYPSWDIEFKIKFPLAIPYSRRIDNILNNLDLDIIHSQHPNLLGSAANKWAKRKKIPLVFTWHTLYDHYIHFSPFLPKKLAIKYIIKKAVSYANKCDTVVVPTDSIVPILKKWGVEKKIIPVATGVIEEEFANPNRHKIRKKYNISDSEILLVLITRITEEKNLEFLLDALADIIRKNKVKFILGGNGYLLPKLKKRAEEAGIGGEVIFPGVIPRNEIKNYLAAGDILVDASKSETQGMHVSEAMYMGLPVVAVDATGVSSLVRNNASGFLVRENKQAFMSAVLKLVEDKNLRDKMGEEARKSIKENFTSGRCAEKMLAVYRKAIENYSK